MVCERHSYNVEDFDFILKSANILLRQKHWHVYRVSTRYCSLSLYKELKSRRKKPIFLIKEYSGMQKPHFIIDWKSSPSPPVLILLCVLTNTLILMPVRLYVHFDQWGYIFALSIKNKLCFIYSPFLLLLMSICFVFDNLWYHMTILQVLVQGHTLELFLLHNIDCRILLR